MSVELGLHFKMEVHPSISSKVRFGDSCDAVKGLPVILALERMADEVSRVIESFAREL